MFERFAYVIFFLAIVMVVAVGPARAQSQQPAPLPPVETQPVQVQQLPTQTQPATNSVTTPVTTPVTQPVSQPATQTGTQTDVKPANTASSAYIKDAKDTYQVFIIGDDLAAGVWGGMTRMTAGDNRLKLNGRYKEQTGFARVDRYDWNGALDKILASKEMDVAVVMIGSNDRKEFRGPGGRYKFGSEDWKKAYTANIDRFIAQLKDKDVAIYWLGQPSMNDPDYDEAMKFVTKIQKERAEAAGVRFLATRPSFVNENDEFTWKGPDIDGVVRRMRAKNGVHFYKRGNNKIANLVLKQLNEDVANAGKDIPAAVANAPAATDANQVRQLGTVQPGIGNNVNAQNAQRFIAPPIFAIEEELAPLALNPPQAKPSQPASTGATQVNVVAATPSNQATGVSGTTDGSVSPAFEQLKASVRPGTPAAQVFQQGLVMAPKKGRVDDASWPRTQ
ncbi:MAG: SGNH/GDSL hydrolase family protein [Hyphomicrobiales bacterium]